MDSEHKTYEKKDIKIKTAKARLTTTHKILITGLTVIGVAVVVVGILIYQKLNIKDEVKMQGNYIIDESNLAEVQDLMSAKVKEGMFELNMNNIWTFPNGTSESEDAYIANSNANSKSVFFDLSLDATGESLYTSTVLPVGTSLKELKLEKDLDAGTYDVTCTYHLLNEDGTESSTLAVGVTVIVTE